MEEGVLRCVACGALWRSVAAQQLIRKDGCLRCGGGPLVATDAAPAEDGPDRGDAR
jgi:predicted  nucleic acid-binding Zn-ribbon protein